MARHPYNQMYNSVLRTTQEMMWDSALDPALRKDGSLDKPAPARTGSLTLDSRVATPRYVNAVDIHCMPGGYDADAGPDDRFAGALYDLGANIYFMGGLGRLNQAMGEVTIRFVRKHYPDIKPKRILDMGCAVGHGTLPYCDAFPDAEIYAVDVGPGLLRYGHERAASLGKNVHFVQMDAERTNYPDGHFDLVVSHLLMHETSNKAVPNIFAECHRLLAPGGVTMHLEGQQFYDLEPYDEYIGDWSTHNNAEPFIGKVRETSMGDLLIEAGFDPAAVIDTTVPYSLDHPDIDASSRGNYGHHFGGIYAMFGARKEA